jgi:hypothetical protein
MKLKLFDSETSPKSTGAGRNSLPRISVTKGGTININGKACELMQLKDGSKITLAQDEEEPENWFMFLNPKGFELRPMSDKKG